MLIVIHFNLSRSFFYRDHLLLAAQEKTEPKQKYNYLQECWKLSLLP